MTCTFCEKDKIPQLFAAAQRQVADGKPRRCMQCCREDQRKRRRSWIGRSEKTVAWRKSNQTFFPESLKSEGNL